MGRYKENLTLRCELANGDTPPTAENFSLQFREETQEEREKTQEEREGRGER